MLTDLIGDFFCEVAIDEKRPYVSGRNKIFIDNDMGFVQHRPPYSQGTIEIPIWRFF